MSRMQSISLMGGVIALALMGTAAQAAPARLVAPPREGCNWVVTGKDGHGDAISARYVINQ